MLTTSFSFFPSFFSCIFFCLQPHAPIHPSKSQVIVNKVFSNNSVQLIEQSPYSIASVFSSLKEQVENTM